MFIPMRMHPSAFYVFALVPIALGHADDDGKTRWYHSLSNVIKDCPYQSWKNVGQDDFFENYRKCVQERALATLDLLLANDIIPIIDGLDLVRFPDAKSNSTEEKRTDSKPEDDSNWTAIIVKRILSVLRTHVFKVDVDHLSGDAATLLNNSKPNSSIFEGRRRRNRRRQNHMVPLLMMGFVLMGSILIPMGFQFLAVLGGKALLLAKMALILSSIQGLKKIATNGVNYGLYHTPVDHGWHDRSHLEPSTNVDHLPFPLQYRP
ncbi:DUF1676 domain-containing protein Osi23 [Augochlora pura]